MLNMICLVLGTYEPEYAVPMHSHKTNVNKLSNEHLHLQISLIINCIHSCTEFLERINRICV